MGVHTFLYRLVMSNVLTLYYSVIFGALLCVDYVVSFFSGPKQLRPKLEPPRSLTDPKYGVHKYIKTNNIKLHYVESGDPSKPLMLFLHGFPEFWYSWRYQILEFSKDYWCIAVDMRGYGDSERPEDLASYHIDVLIEDVRDLIRQLGRDKFILVGHDWGGLISCRFRDLYPELLHAVILLGSTSREAWLKELWSNADQRKMSWYNFFIRMPGLAEILLQKNNLEMFDTAMITKGKDTVNSEDIECYKYWFGKQFAFTPPLNYYRANFVYTLPEKNINSKVPFLIINAADDIYLSVNLLNTMKTEYEDIETAVVGHVIGEEFRNRKGYFSLNVHAICDADFRFMNVVARWPGSRHDATIFNNSVFSAQCDVGQFGNLWMLGDSAYPNRPYLLTPDIWHLERRFPVLALTLRLSLSKAQAIIIIATAVLHNICRTNNLGKIPAEVQLPAGDFIHNDTSENQGATGTTLQSSIKWRKTEMLTRTTHHSHLPQS